MSFFGRPRFDMDLLYLQKPNIQSRRKGKGFRYMDENKRLKLISEAIRYCQRVRKMGMPPSGYTKALREPIYYLWECRNESSKSHNAAYRSKQSKGLAHGSGLLVRDHAVPFKHLQDRLLSLSPVTTPELRSLLDKLCVGVLVTKDEHSRLHAAHITRQLAENWFDKDIFGRYGAAGITLEKNSGIADRGISK
jgi:hypothetical protein